MSQNECGRQRRCSSTSTHRLSALTRWRRALPILRFWRSRRRGFFGARGNLSETIDHACGEVNGVTRTIADRETFFTAEVAGEPVVVVRDKEGTLRAFSNVCRHRAGPIALGSGCKNVLRCAVPRLDLHPGRTIDWHAGCGGRGVFRSQHDGYGAAAGGNVGAVYFCEFRPRRRVAVGLSGRNPEQAAGISVCGAAICRAARLRDQLQLEGVRRQLFGGLSHSDRASRVDARDRLLAVSDGHVSVSLAAVCAHPSDESGGRG